MIILENEPYGGKIMVSQKRRLLRRALDDYSCFTENVLPLFPNMTGKVIMDSQQALVSKEQNAEISSLQTLKENRERTRRILGKTVQKEKIRHQDGANLRVIM